MLLGRRFGRRLCRSAYALPSGCCNRHIRQSARGKDETQASTKSRALPPRDGGEQRARVDQAVKRRAEDRERGASNGCSDKREHGGDAQKFFHLRPVTSSQ